ncbi:uncharacterized protein THITE_2044078 [Thermothielavioides terrestris NRRL 8126]|uniref:NEK6-subfamily protein kinase n=1 Tax=Thermothielavioides terrestris (strain ATCC 38088 / NRRL 8126) TaxID=578455 RepID=G2R0F6_THETT|nr:uncharacterized protein THITE_2044078 [Thermothielavioides terrestris NRRL 8126]AEO65621.1 hypothetical protein THITE_2044078 [Thermothielavioides terrestris NRRL 8126]
MPIEETFYLFALLPRNPGARKIVKANPKYRRTVDGNDALCFKANHKSKFPGRLVSIGRLAPMNDVVLLDEGAQMQCSFSLVPSGELLLEDATTGHHTYLEWRDKNDKKRDQYSLQGDPRRRVIPLAPSGRIVLEIGTNIRFHFVWQVRLDQASVERIRSQLARFAQANLVPEQGMTLDVPRDPRLAPTAFEKRTKNTPEVPKEYDGQPLRQIHVYKELGRGAFGVVYKAVDLATGRLWAVKECKPGNILYSGSHDRPKSFCISDLGLGVSEWSVDRHRIAGTVVYMAPETSRRGRTSAASDVYSFGIVLLELLGIYCHREGEPERYSVSAWRRKLRLLGAAARDAERYTDKPASRDDEVPEVQVAHSRLKSLVDCRAVPRALAAVLEENPGRRASAADARQPLKTTYSGAAPALAGRPREADRARERDVAPFAPPALRRRHTGGMTVRTDMTGRTGITRLTGMTGRPRVVRFDLPIRAR